jgi:hypothetical protein
MTQKQRDLRRAYSLLAALQTSGELVAGAVKYTDSPRRLLIDLDGEVPTFVQVARRLRELWLTPLNVSYQRSRTHWHMVVDVEQRLTLMERVFCQLYLGSDPLRESWTFIHAHFYQRRDNLVQVLFEEKITL